MFSLPMSTAMTVSDLAFQPNLLEQPAAPVEAFDLQAFKLNQAVEIFDPAAKRPEPFRIEAPNVVFDNAKQDERWKIERELDILRRITTETLEDPTLTKEQKKEKLKRIAIMMAELELQLNRLLKLLNGAPKNNPENVPQNIQPANPADPIAV